MGFLVGNDFIPHLPHLHIANNILPMLYKTYMEVLPTLDGYLNEGGTVNLKRFGKYIGHLSKVSSYAQLADSGYSCFAFPSLIGTSSKKSLLTSSGWSQK